MGKDKTDAGSWKLKYVVSVKDPEADGLITARMKVNQGKIVVDMGGGIPEMTKEQLARVAMLLNSKIDQINNSVAANASGHISSLRIIGTYCNELANYLELGDTVENIEGDD